MTPKIGELWKFVHTSKTMVLITKVDGSNIHYRRFWTDDCVYKIEEIVENKTDICSLNIFQRLARKVS